MAKKFQTVLKKARFVVDGFQPPAMKQIGQDTRDSIESRIGRGLNANDQAGRALSSRYALYKQRKGLKPLRDWFKTGRTRRSMKVLSAGTNTARIGFTDTITGLRAAVNNRIERAFAVSPNDRAVLIESVKRQESPVKAKVA